MSADSAGTTGPRAKCDQVIFEALAKATEIIVQSRGGGANESTSVASPSSSRFNLTLPENPALRGILSRWRRALHLPIRLDVYYQHEDGRCELLERWCLGYQIGDAFWRDQHNAALFQKQHGSGNSSTDHIVQLRHVCKKIVVWLRTLHCFARLLPSTAFLNAKMQTTLQQPQKRNKTVNNLTSAPTVGFSLYAVSAEDGDDINQLLEQGFLRHGQPAAALTTPYGELSWQVFCAKSDTVERLLPRTVQRGTANYAPRTTTRTPAIPISTPQEHQRNQNFQYAGGQPQTAPAHMNQFLAHEGNTFSGQQQAHSQWQQQAQQQQFQTNTYNPRYLSNKTASFNDNDDTNIPRHGLLQRRHTSIGQESEIKNTESPQTTPAPIPPPGDKPERVLSGLSLALMNSNNNGNGANELSTEVPQHQEATTLESGNAAAVVAAEKRRAALHQMPPHLQQQQAMNSSREYGYAYNNHIPSMQNKGLNPLSPQGQSAARPVSPATSLGTTPPLGVLYLAGGGTSVGKGSTTSPALDRGFIPPRKNSNTAMTPPFAPRPMGFEQDQKQSPPPSAPLTMLPSSTAGTDLPRQHQEQIQTHPSNTNDLPPLTSLDMLHHSPFHPTLGSTSGGVGISMLSSLASGGGVGPLLGSEAASVFYSHSTDLRKSSFLLLDQQQQPPPSPYHQDEYEEMPFAVEETLPSTEQATETSVLASSAQVASFAQKCSVHQRLQLFDQPQHNNNNNNNNSTNNVMDRRRLRPEQHCGVLNRLLELSCQQQQQQQQQSQTSNNGKNPPLAVVLLQWLTEQAREPSQLHLFCEAPPAASRFLLHRHDRPNHNAATASTSTVLSQVARLLHMPGPAQEGAAELIRTLTAHEVMDPYLMSAAYQEQPVHHHHNKAEEGPAIQEEVDDESSEEDDVPLQLQPRTRGTTSTTTNHHHHNNQYDLLCVLAHVVQDSVSALPQARIHAGIAMMNLSCGQANKARMAQCADVLQAMKSILYEQAQQRQEDCRQDWETTTTTNDGSNQNLLETLQLKAATTLKNLSNLDSNDVALISCPGMLHALGHVILQTTLRTSHYHHLGGGNSSTGPTATTTNACMALMNLSISKRYKSQIYHTPGVMQALLTVLAQTSILNMPTLLSLPQEEGLWESNHNKSSSDTEAASSPKPTATETPPPAMITTLNSSAQEARIRACSVLSNLAIGYDNKISMFIYPGFVEAILVMIRTDPGEARSKACSILWSLAAEMENQVPMVHERHDIVPVLIQVASDHTDLNQDSRQKCVACLTLLAESPHNAMELLRAGVLQPLFEILNQAGSDPSRWKDHTASWCVSCLMNLAQVDTAVPVLRQGGAVELLAPLVVLDQHYQSLKAAMAVTLCCRLDHDFLRQPAAGSANHHSFTSPSSSWCYYDLLRKTETAIPKIVNLLHNTLAGRGGEGYKYGVFTMSSSVACIAALASGPEFLQEHICTTPVLVSLLQVLWDFAVDGGVPGCIVGGGRDDMASATWAVKAIHSIVTYLLDLGEDGSGAYGETFLQPSLVDPLVCALRSVEQRLLQPQGASNDGQFENKEICALAAQARQLISSAAIHEQQRHHERRRRRRRLNTSDGTDDDSDCQSRSSSSSSASSCEEGPFVIKQSFVMTPQTIPTTLTETSTMSAMDTTNGSEESSEFGPNSSKMASPPLSPTSQTGYETPTSPSSPVSTRTTVRTFLLSDSCSGRRFVVPTDPRASRTSHRNTDYAKPEDVNDGDDNSTDCQRPPRLWCFRRGRFCREHEVPDPNYIWTPELQRAYEMALERAQMHRQRQQRSSSPSFHNM